MKDWTRVLLYGTFDGFTYSTDDLPPVSYTHLTLPTT